MVNDCFELCVFSSVCCCPGEKLFKEVGIRKNNICCCCIARCLDFLSSLAILGCLGFGCLSGVFLSLFVSVKSLLLEHILEHRSEGLESLINYGVKLSGDCFNLSLGRFFKAVISIMLNLNLLAVKLCVGYGVAFEELGDEVGNDETVVLAVDEVVENYGDHVLLIAEVSLRKASDNRYNIL